MGAVSERVAFCAMVVVGPLFSGTTVAAADMTYGVADKPWPAPLGNHRVRIHVARQAGAVWAHIPWRRRDRSPQDKGIVVHDPTGKAVTNVVRVEANREFGDIAFQPQAGAGEYYVYTMPFAESRVPHRYVTEYAKPKDTCEAGWLARHGLTRGRLVEGTWRSLPKATVIKIEARSAFHRFDPMEVIATAAETQRLVSQHAGRGYLLFPEDREHPIRMTDDLPLRWVRRGPTGAFLGEALRGEFYVLQIGVFAARQAIDAIAVAFGDLRSGEGQQIPATAFRCFNVGGIDWLGRPFGKTVSVGKGKVQPLWFGVQIRKDQAAGQYQGALTLRPKNAEPTTVTLSLAVSDQVIEDAGDGDLWRLARLRWLDSTIGLDDEPTAPYTPLAVDGGTVACLGRRVQFGDTGLPDSIRSAFTKAGRIDNGKDEGREILAGPIALAVATRGGEVKWTGGAAKIIKTAAGAATVESRSTGGPIKMVCQAKMEFDGYVNYRITVKADRAVDVEDIRLEIPLRRDVATYMMGMGRKGGYRPKEWKWQWDVNRANNSLWLGDVDAGLHCRLKGPADAWELYTLRSSGIPAAWGNGGKGGCTVAERGADSVLIRAYSGKRRLEAGDELQYCFGLLITPVKPLDPAHWQQRYYHAYVPVETAVKVGANIINIHHGNELNPNINYPFRAVDKLAAYVKRAHAKDVKVKIYYTVRELSNYVAEMWALRSLGHEVFVGGPGGGHSWLCEHLVSDYGKAWHHVFGNGEVDAAIAQTGLSRWHNYYLEGLGWLIRHVGIDGLYLDGIGYDREIMKRVRRVMDRTKPGCLIDFHSGNNFHPNYGLSNCANQYMEHFPYINSIWFGEGYDYNESPDYWLVEVSGLPFGLFGEMLHGGGNPWRGMVYGMTGRYYQNANPGRIWKVWDTFGIADARMIGYWVPSCPVQVDQKDVLATAYCKKDKVLISLASWAKAPVRCQLKIDWQALGLRRDKANLFAPAIAGFQPPALFRPSDAIPVNPGRGWLLILDERPHEMPATADVYKDRTILLVGRFAGDRLGAGWSTHLSKQPDTKLTVRDGSIAIEAKANCIAYAERGLPPDTTLVDCHVYSGTDHGATWGPGLCLVWPGNKILRINLRAEGRLGVDDGRSQWFGGFSAPETWHRLRIRLEDKQVLAEISADGRFWEPIHAADRSQFAGAPVAVRLGKMSGDGKNEDHHVLGPPGGCAIKALRVFGPKR